VSGVPGPRQPRRGRAPAPETLVGRGPRRRSAARLAGEIRHDEFPSAFTLLRVAALSAAAIVIMFVLWNRPWVDAGVPLVAQGHIGDSRCAGGHAHAAAELPDMSGGDCVRRCVEMGAQYVFVSQGVVYPIRNQDFVDLTQFAGQNVQLEGEVRQNLLTVSHVRPLNVRHSHDDFFSRKVRAS
jgi:hypothetical protein